MRRMFHALIIVTSVFAVTACADRQESSAGSPDDNAASETAVAAVETDGWVIDDDTADLEAVDVSPDLCHRILHPLGQQGCPVGQPCPCPSGYTCLYQDANREGFGVGVVSGCRIHNLRNVRCTNCTDGTHGNDGTFNDQMSSWQNANGDGRQSCWWFDVNQGPPKNTMADGVTRNQVPAANNDQASEFGACG